MANEFIARKGLIVLANGAKVTGSLLVQGDINAIGYNVTASNLALLGSASIDGDVSIGGNITVGNADIDVIKFLAEVSSSIVPDVNNSFDLGSDSKAWRDLYVSGTAYVNNTTATGVQTITNTTNSTNYTDGALIVQGGVGITKDVNISGSLTVTGLLTAVSTSIQYVTSSQLTLGISRVIVNDDDLVRFAGLSVVDSGSTFGTGSLLWDSLNNRWIYETDDQTYNSAVSIAGPKNTGSLGDEVGLIEGRIPVATGDHNIDTNPSLTPLRVAGTTLHAEGNVYVTGSVTSSVGFSGSFYGDGSNLSGIATNLEQITANGATTSTQVLLNGGAVIHGVLYTSGSNLDVDIGTEVIATVSTGSYDAAFFDYVVKRGTNYRAGTVMAVWDDTSNVEFTDTSTNDLGNTSDISFTVDTLLGDVRLKAVATSNSWVIKTAIRAF
jgi:hypothetical protein